MNRAWLGLAWILATALPGAARDWNPEIFDYDRPPRLEVTEKGEPGDKLPDTRQQEVAFRNLRGEPVTVLITYPPKGKGPFPAVLAVHALGSDRQQISRDLGRALAARGFACVAPDLPFHGGRAVKGRELFLASDPEQTYRNVVGAIVDVRQTIDLIKERKDLYSDKGVPLVGYSLGAWFGTLAGSADRRVSALVLQGGGIGGATAGTGKDRGKPDKSEQTLLQRYPTLRPQVAIPFFEPRPILMQNGKRDPFISEEHARNLYREAKAPKEIRWYDSGHILPEKAARDLAEWLDKLRKG
jgi:fermentation-respiration switch protein FrsA (DUF1100 family)